jgi:ABC-type sugar transport system ATPase subunit
MAPVLRVAGVSKTFPGLRALDDVGLEVAAGEIVSIVGQNGSGKSTLVKILAGLHEPDPGARIEAGELRFIHQDLGLVPGLTTVENLALGRAERWGAALRPLRRQEERRAAALAVARFGGTFEVGRPVGELSAAERAIVAIARALDRWDGASGVLVLDEPTASLPAREAARLFDAVRAVAAHGAGVLFISHRLDEVLDLSDRVVALRGGRVVADVPAGEVDHHGLVSLIVGRAVEAIEVEHHVGAPVLRVRDLHAGTLDGVTLDVHAGEVVGVAGLLGSGREDLAATIFGAQRATGGAVSVDGAAVHAGDPAAAIRAGMGFVPADRPRHGAVMTLSARENLTLPMLGPLRRAGRRLDRRAEQAEVAEWTRTVGLHPAHPERAMAMFSGGNQQKVVLARWLRMRPRVLLLDEPTQGVDVGAKAAIYELVLRAAAEGAAVLVASSDDKELALLCDRVIVLRDGRASAELDRRALSEERLVHESLGTAAGSPTPVTSR